LRLELTDLWAKPLQKGFSFALGFRKTATKTYMKNIIKEELFLVGVVKP